MSKSYSVKLTQSDDELISLLCKSSSEEAFNVIYVRYHRLLYVLAYKYLKSSSMAEDAVQQIFLKLWESRSLLIIQVNLRNYLYTILKNHVLNEIRNNNNAVEKNYKLIQSTPEYEDELLAKIEERDMMMHFHQAIDHLPEQQKRVCLYKLKGDLTNQDIAELMHISLPTVKTHYAQAIKTLRIHFERLFIIFVSLIVP